METNWGKGPTAFIIEIINWEKGDSYKLFN